MRTLSAVLWHCNLSCYNLSVLLLFKFQSSDKRKTDVFVKSQISLQIQIWMNPHFTKTMLLRHCSKRGPSLSQNEGNWETGSEFGSNDAGELSKDLCFRFLAWTQVHLTSELGVKVVF